MLTAMSVHVTVADLDGRPPNTVLAARARCPP
jgi:hypothetical protein